MSMSRSGRKTLADLSVPLDGDKAEDREGGEEGRGQPGSHQGHQGEHLNPIPINSAKYLHTHRKNAADSLSQSSEDSLGTSFEANSHGSHRDGTPHSTNLSDSQELGFERLDPPELLPKLREELVMLMSEGRESECCAEQSQAMQSPEASVVLPDHADPEEELPLGDVEQYFQLLVEESSEAGDITIPFDSPSGRSNSYESTPADRSEREYCAHRDYLGPNASDTSLKSLPLVTGQCVNDASTDRAREILQLAMAGEASEPRDSLGEPFDSSRLLGEHRDHSRESSRGPVDSQQSRHHSRESSRGTNGHLSDSSAAGNYTSNNNRTNRLGSHGSDKKKKASNWYSVLSPTYKSRSEDFRRIFKETPNDERLIVDYSCALQKDILVHGRLYVSQNWICFYANIFRWETVLTIRCRDITAMTKEKTARVIPNAIQICTDTDKYFFTSFGTRDKTFLMMFRVWQNALMDQPMHPHELWQWVHYSYGEELGLTSSDDDYIAPTQEDEMMFQARLQQEEKLSPSDNNTHSDNTHKDDQDQILIGGDSPSASLLSPGNDIQSLVSTSMTSMDEGPTPSPTVSNKTPSPSHQLNSTPSHLTVPSLDGHNGDLPTDLGDTTEDEEGVAQCTCLEHDGIPSLDETFNLSVDQVFNFIFSEDSVFYSDFIQTRKTSDLRQSPWPDAPDTDGNKVRTISYTLSLNYSIGPKTCNTIEKQIWYGYSKPGYFYVVDAEVVNEGVPYSESFHTVNRYCLTRITTHKCRLRITTNVKYKKGVWGLVKNFIDKTATQGVYDNFEAMAAQLHIEAEKLAQLVTVPPLRKKVLRRRRCHSNTGDRSPSLKRASGESQHKGSQQGTPVKGKKGATSKEEWHITFNTDSLVRIVIAVLIMLVMFNAVLFYKLYSLEGQAAAGLHHPHHDFLANLHNQPRSHEEWVKLLSQQQHLHETEIDRWKDILSASVQLMDQMKQTLVSLQQTIEQRSKFMTNSDPPPSE